MIIANYNITTSQHEEGRIGAMRNITKLIEEYKKTFMQGNSRAGDLTAKELDELIRIARESSGGRKLTEEGRIGTAVILTWEAAFIAGYRSRKNEERKLRKERGTA